MNKNEMDKQTQEALDLLSVVEPGTADSPRPARQAFSQLNTRLDQAEQQTWQFRLHRFFSVPGGRYATATVLAVLMLAFVFSFPTVRVAASEFLSLFRVQNITAVSISPEQIALLSQVAEGGELPGKLIIENEPGDLTPANSIQEAAALTGMTHVRTLGKLGTPDQIYVSDEGNGRFIIDLEGSRAILEAVGADPMLLPDNLDGSNIEVAVFAGVDQQWGEDLHLLQSESPLVEYPDGLDTAALGEALLQLLGLNEDEAYRLAQDIDWTSTLLLPIPQDIATYREVTVDGVSGIAISELDGSAGTIIWQQDGIIYSLFGSRGMDELVELANSLE
ncbi:MAG: DUF4367 domain-containing protein [Chloroflexi bacterium]|nr:DUF4367 domain-containing protein [Chloroflexota bacterium]